MALKAEIVIPVDEHNTMDVVERITERLADEFGGYSLYEGTGGWLTPSGIVKEPHVRVETIIENPDDTAKDTIRDEAWFVNQQLDQDAVLVEFQEVNMELI